MTEIMQWNSAALPQTDRLSLQSPLRPLCVLVFYVLLVHSCRGQSQVIGSPQLIVARVGDDTILPCHLKPAVNVAALMVEWTRSHLSLIFVHVWRDGQDLKNVKHPSYKGRTSLFINELKYGKIFLKLSKVQLSDEGTYECFIPALDNKCFVKLVVGAVSSPVIGLSGIDRDKGGVVLQCESAGWYPEPEVFWLDGEGNLLSAGPTETVRGPDDLYTVSSRVTVEKRHSNSFTCRVQQKDINQTRETHIQVPDVFFEVRSSSSSVTVGLAVCLAVCIVIILLLIFSVWKWRQNRIKIKRSHRDETDKGEQKVGFKSNKTEVQVDVEGESEQLMTDETVTMKDLKNRKGEKETKHLERSRVAPVQPSFPLSKWMIVSRQTFQDEQQRREEAENRVQTLEEELQTKIRELEDNKQAADTEGRKSSDELNEENPEPENKNAEKDSLKADVHSLTEEIDTKTNEMEKLQETRSKKPEKEGKEKRKTGGKKAEKEVKKPEKQEPECDSPQSQQQDDTDSASLQDMSAGRVFEVEVDKSRKYIHLRNKSSEEQELGGWTLKVQINDREPISYTFKEPFKLGPGKTLTMWVQGFGTHCPPSDLVWKDLKSWSPGDKLQVFLIKNTGEIQHLSVHTSEDVCSELSELFQRRSVK